MTNKEEEIEVNRTHICILQKRDGLIEPKLIELKFPYEKSIEELEVMAENPNRTKYELEEFVKGSPLNLMIKSFNFCRDLSRPYQDRPNYHFLTYDEFKEQIEAFKLKLKERAGTEEDLDIEKELRSYHQKDREKVVDGIKSLRIPFLLDLMYDDCQKDKNVLAFSHRKIGFSLPEFKLGEDFDVVFKTNFGYGSSSYFYTNIRYKNIDILPYSDWVKYRIADKYEIIRYTRRHRLKNESWRVTMDFTSDLYNHSVNSPSTFVNDYIINECDEMVKGLESILNSTKSCEVVTNFFNPNYSVKIEGIELIDYKGEKISGALTFIVKIKELNPISNKIDIYIDRVLSYNLTIYYELLKNIESLKASIKRFESELFILEPKWKRVKFIYDELQMVRVDFLEKLKASKSEMTHDEMKIASEKYIRDNDALAEVKIHDFEEVDLIYRNLQSKIHSNKAYKIKFELYRDTIEKYFKEAKMVIKQVV